MDQKERDHKEEAGGRSTEHTNAILESGPGRTTAWSVAGGGEGSGRSGTGGMTQ